MPLLEGLDTILIKIAFDVMVELEANNKDLYTGSYYRFMSLDEFNKLYHNKNLTKTDHKKHRHKYGCPQHNKDGYCFLPRISYVGSRKMFPFEIYHHYFKNTIIQFNHIMVEFEEPTKTIFWHTYKLYPNGNSDVKRIGEYVCSEYNSKILKPVRVALMMKDGKWGIMSITPRIVDVMNGDKYKEWLSYDRDEAYRIMKYES